MSNFVRISVLFVGALFLSSAWGLAQAGAFGWALAQPGPEINFVRRPNPSAQAEAQTSNQLSCCDIPSACGPLKSDIASPSPETRTIEPLTFNCSSHNGNNQEALRATLPIGAGSKDTASCM